MSLSKFESIVSETASLMGKYYPADWLNGLQGGESPLLGRAECEFITDVQNRIIQEARSRLSFACYKPLRYKLSVMKANFHEVLQYLKKCSQRKEYFVINYPRWRYFRDQAIQKLIDIAESVDSLRKEKAEVKQAGSSLSLIGGVICLVTGAGAMGLLGKAMIGFGSVGSILTSVDESDQLQKMIKEAEEIIKVDKEYSEKLWNCISDISHIPEALDTISNIDIDRNLKKVAIDLNACFKKKSSPEQLEMVIKTFMKSLKFSPKSIKEISDVIGILIAIPLLFERYRPLFNQAFKAFQCYKALSSNLIADTLKLVSGGAQLNNFQKSRIFTGIALDAINIILASKGLESKSKEAEDILKAAEKLKVEAKEFEKLYINVINT